MAAVSELCEFCCPSFRYVAEWYVQTEADLEDSGKLPRALCGRCLRYFNRPAFWKFKGPIAHQVNVT